MMLNYQVFIIKMLCNYISIKIFYIMLKYQVLIIKKSQVKFSSWSKDGHNAHF